MNLREWLSNSKVFNESIPKEEKVKGETTKVLGIQWNSEADTMAVRILPFMHDTKLTKRIILHNIANFFDPLGFLSPLTMKGKLIFQQLWRARLD